MAVLVEAISVIIRAEAILSRYPGGWEQFRSDCPNRTLCADGELARVGFMAPPDVQHFCEKLAGYGIQYVHNRKAVDLVVADQREGFTAPCAWAELGRVKWQGDPTKTILACRFAGSKNNQIVTPLGWTYEDSLSSKYKFMKTHDISEFLDPIGHKGGLDIYQDIETGKDVYIGRTSCSKSHNDRRDA